MARTRLIGLVVAGVALGAAAVGIVAAVDDGPEPSEASTPAAARPAQDGAGTGTASETRTITVSGLGTATGIPDTADVWIGVQAEGATANAALDRANESAAALLEVLKGAGIDETDIQTTNVSLYPTYDNEGRRITGYVASNDLSVTVRDLDELGKVLDAATGLVGDEIRIGGISLYVDDTEALESEARADAIADARRSADEYAAAAGVEVGQVLSISEVTTPTVPITYGFDRAAAEGAPADEVPISAGSQEYSLSVTVVYEIA
jgi:uncharacterized protein YggE